MLIVTKEAYLQLKLQIATSVVDRWTKLAAENHGNTVSQIVTLANTNAIEQADDLMRRIGIRTQLEETQPKLRLVNPQLEGD